MTNTPLMYILMVFPILAVLLLGLWIATAWHLYKNKDVPNRKMWAILHISTLTAPFYYFLVMRPGQKGSK